MSIPVVPAERTQVSSQRKNFLFRSKSIVWGYLPLVPAVSNKLNLINISLWKLHQGRSRGRASSLPFVCILSQLFPKPVSSPELLPGLFRVNPCLTCHNQGKEILSITQHNINMAVDMVIPPQLFLWSLIPSQGILWSLTTIA